MPATIVIFTFNPFQENTYIVFDETKECAIIDPGCFEAHERIELDKFIQDNELKPVRLINTHCHLDHVFGNAFVSRTWELELEIHKGELPVLEAVPQIAKFYGMPSGELSPAPGRFIEEGEVIAFGKTKMEAILTPGHSPASLSFYIREGGLLLAGDVLFREGIGRTDLPGGDYDTLIASIKDKLLPLGDEVKVFPGHGPSTTIGHERRHNPFL
ncbi:MAG: MBL fold metallo-hydrolase [Saprospiraceae bacterium]|nr:MBL fold metallo-hydrolase [Saprospiraceae bacterium]